VVTSYLIQKKKLVGSTTELQLIINTSTARMIQGSERMITKFLELIATGQMLYTFLLARRPPLPLRRTVAAMPDRYSTQEINLSSTAEDGGGNRCAFAVHYFENHIAVIGNSLPLPYTA
jgi:hypothetical protein